ncbi:Crp/Fnr family transcriptional regulator [Rhizohabitans arisaemae]|uniref:Crp/Fnr family transcriptional regulator n=1 Tax=Rhizohabitans arisaemae TaxID=2720610 RepID=UPI0024B0B697|nr:Crp/Fnr family transcriptional regulator [Rhizohabitans arisaemae]
MARRTATGNDVLRKVGGWPKSSLLGTLEERTRDELLRLGSLQQYATGEILLMEGERSTHVFLLIEACVKVTSTTEDGKLALLAIRMGGDLVGELAGLDGEPRVATVTAAGPCVVRRMSQEVFVDFLTRHPAASLAVNRSVAGKLRHATRRRAEFGSRATSTRLARVLLELARNYGEAGEEGVVIGVSLTQPELAALVGAADPTIHKALTQLRRGGVVETGYRRIVIRDMATLRLQAGMSPNSWDYEVPGAPGTDTGRI